MGNEGNTIRIVTGQKHSAKSAEERIREATSIKKCLEYLKGQLKELGGMKESMDYIEWAQDSIQDELIRLADEKAIEQIDALYQRMDRKAAGFGNLVELKRGGA
ncbi:MAG: hypothetical protein ACPGOV_07755 [Magnetovibrionaceae bacterium]